MEKEIMREEEVKSKVKELNEKYQLDKIRELVKNNIVEFEHNEIKYRVRLLTMRDKEELDELRRKKFGQLIKDRDILLEKDLIKTYKERGIYIEEINEKIRKLDLEEKDRRIKLGESLAKNAEDSVLNKYKQEIYSIIQSMDALTIQKSTLLEYSLENQLLNYVAKIITYLSLDKYEEGEWKRAFNNQDEFINSKDEELITKAASYSLFMQYM